MSDWTNYELELARRVEIAGRNSVAAVIAMGDAIAEAKGLMRHGRFGAWIEQALPISPYRARQAMRIARDPNIRRLTDSGVLPSDRVTLDEISGLSREQFDQLVRKGTIHARMKRGDVKRELRPESVRPPRHVQIEGAPREPESAEELLQYLVATLNERRQSEQRPSVVVSTADGVALEVFFFEPVREPSQ